MRRLAVGLAVLLACVPEIKEHCPLLTEPRSPPALPRDLALLDALLVRRATEMVDTSRGLHRFQVRWFRVGFAEQFLPDLCARMERARTLAMAGRTAEAGRKYQGLLIASQVMQFAIAVHAVAQSAEMAGQPGGEITQTLETFAAQMSPILEAALSEDPRRIARAISEQPAVFRDWARYLERWPSRITEASERVRVAQSKWCGTQPSWWRRRTKLLGRQRRSLLHAAHPCHRHQRSPWVVRPRRLSSAESLPSSWPRRFDGSSPQALSKPP
ncbi:MAG TPA: hypothetical protein VFI41_06025 [Gemmatimonadales bacterium]|nr:hypothetical protein [Gemmatimonadales bacterium]